MEAHRIASIAFAFTFAISPAFSQSQPFFENLTLEHCKENSKWGDCDELLKREREAHEDLAKDWHYYDTRERLQCIAASPLDTSLFLPYSLQLKTCLATVRSSRQ
jgi:hypothetical protein